MKKQIAPYLVYLFSSVLWSMTASPAFAQSAAISYQGRLTQAGNPVTGIYDMQFKLFDTAAVGTGAQQGAAINNSAVPVTNGVFTVTLDFGAAVFDGSPRFLEIGVRPGGVSNPYNLLAPRQQVTSIPYAIQSLNAATAATALNVASGSVVKSLNTLKDDVILAEGPNVTITPSGNTLTIASTGTSGVGGSSLWNLNGADLFYTAGNVGIGTNNPTPGLRLEVDGNVRLHPNGGIPGGFIQFGTPNGETGMSISGTNRADIRFDGSTLKLLAGVGLGAMPSGNGIAITTNGDVVIGPKSYVYPFPKLEVNGDTVFAGHIGMNIQALSGVTLAIDPGGAPQPFLVYDSDGVSMFYLDTIRLNNPTPPFAYNSLHMNGDAYKSSGGTSWGTFSDRRLKQDVRAYEPGLKEVLQLRPVRFRYRDDPKRSLTSNHEEVGFIAQDVREVIPDAVTEDKDEYLSLKADPIHWAAINAIQELNVKLAEQRAENAELKRRLEKLEQRMNQKLERAE
ncbi:MAG: tail fiber domain-containing protein [Verrucomicrobia bacterium]|nr:tail fiber domain-containing protein [Verrucomicrobiota bacterium]